MQTESFIIVQRGRYWAGFAPAPRFSYRRRPRLSWTADPEAAVHFAREIDATRSIQALRTQQLYAKVIKFAANS